MTIPSGLADLESGKNTPNAKNQKTAANPALVTNSAKQNAKSKFENELSNSLTSFKLSQHRSEERLGVLLLLDYKFALDELNADYNKLVQG